MRFSTAFRLLSAGGFRLIWVYLDADCWQYPHLRSLTRRPIAPLLYRSACNFVFAAQFIIAHLFLSSNDGLRLEFNASTCTNLAFVTQVTLLASECWYFVVSLDVVTDLFFSPFNNATKRIAGYHVVIWSFSISMAVVLVTTGEAGPSEVFCIDFSLIFCVFHLLFHSFSAKKNIDFLLKNIDF